MKAVFLFLTYNVHLMPTKVHELFLTNLVFSTLSKTPPSPYKLKKNSTEKTKNVSNVPKR